MMQHKKLKNKEILEAYNSLRPNSETNQTIDCLKVVLAYLKSLSKEICQTELKPSFIHQWTFKTVFKKKREYECYLKANIFTASKSLERLIKNIETNEVSNIKSRLIQDFLCDLKPFISYYDLNQDYSWLLQNTNSLNSNFYFDLATHTFWNGQPSENLMTKQVLSTSTPFFIRQSIEYKIKRILAIDYIEKDGKPYIKTLELCFKVIDECSDLFKIKKGSFEEIKNIHSWTHTYIHGGYRPEPWKTEYALHYLKDLFFAGKTSTGFCEFAGIELCEKDLPKLKETTNLVINGLNENLNIKWLHRHEVSVIKNK